MNKKTQRMPIIMAKLTKKLFNLSNNVIRDFSEITHVRQRNGFAKSMINQLKRLLEEECGVFWFDGLDNFTSSIHLFSLVALINNNFIIIEPLIQNVYWTYNNSFYINDLNPNVLGYDYAINTDVIPVSLGISWFQSHYVSKFEYTKNHSVLILNNTENDNYTNYDLEYHLIKHFNIEITENNNIDNII